VNDVPTAYTYLKNGANPLNGQRLSSDGVNAYTWDVNGSNLTRNGAPGNFTFGYDPDNRLASITGAGTATRTYDYYDRGAWKTGSDGATSYVYDGLDLVRDDTGPTTRGEVVRPSVDDQPAVSSSHILSFTQEDPYLSLSPRYRNPWLPRLLGRSLTFRFGPLGTYIYAFSEPLHYADPLGLWSLPSIPGSGTVTVFVPRLGPIGPGGAINFGHFAGCTFGKFCFGFGAGGGFSWNPGRGFPEPNPNRCPFFFAGFDYGASASAGPLSGGWGGSTGVSAGTDPKGHIGLDPVHESGTGGALGSGWGFGASGSFTVCVGAQYCGD
jgi:hypothetical protein